jgi:ribokinase
MPASPRIVVVGSASTDLIVRVPRIPAPGETIIGSEFLTAPGGKGANQAVAAARAGARVSLVAAVGADSAGDALVTNFRRDKIDVKRLVRDRRASSGVAFIFVGDDGQNAIAVAAGANRRLSAAHVRRARSEIARAAIVLIQLETPMATVAATIAVASDAKVPVILNPAPATKLDDKLLRTTAVLTPNETEATLLTGVRVRDERSARRAAEALRARGAATVIVTLGATGALLVNGAGAKLIPGFRVNAVDTTAAGDVFNGALATRLAEGAAIEQAIRFAHAAAAISVTRIGAQPSIPARSEIERFLRQRR